MNQIKKISLSLILTICIVFFIGVWDLAGESVNEPSENPIADVTMGANGIGFSPKVSYAQMVLTVSGPDGSVFSKTFDTGVSPYLGLNDNNGNYFIDGSYTYELRVAPVLRQQARTAEASGQGILPKRALTQTGYFTVEGGSIVTGAAPEGLASPQDVLHYDDVIITGSLCVGFDCADGESFGFDTIILKEHNLRIYFNDTSYTASYPTNSWRITINDSTNGGASYFSVDDVDDGTSIFKIEAGAPSNSLYVEDYGRVGLGTSTPVVELHIKDSDTPTLRLEQDSSGGWTAQTWDVAGNESNFFVRDATNGSKLPFRIQPSTPSSTLCLKSDGKVGVGTWSPAYPMELETTSENASFVCDRTDGATNFISATATYGQFGTVSDNSVRILVNSSPIMTINGSGDYIEMVGGGTYDGTWNPSCSRELKENIEDLNLDEAINAVENLSPVKYNYKKNKAEARVGFIAEDVPDLVATNSRKTLSTLDILAVLTKVVQEQQKTISDLKKEMSDLKKELRKK